MSKRQFRASKRAASSPAYPPLEEGRRPLLTRLSGLVATGALILLGGCGEPKKTLGGMPDHMHAPIDAMVDRWSPPDGVVSSGIPDMMWAPLDVGVTAEAGEAGPPDAGVPSRPDVKE